MSTDKNSPQEKPTKDKAKDKTKDNAKDLQKELEKIAKHYSTKQLKKACKTFIEEHPKKNEDELVENWRSGCYPYKRRMSKIKYEKEKFDLQVELLKLQAWVKETGQRVVILFEGRDAAGKGGTIKRFMEHLNKR